MKRHAKKIAMIIDQATAKAFAEASGTGDFAMCYAKALQEETLKQRLATEPPPSSLKH